MVFDMKSRQTVLSFCGNVCVEAAGSIRPANQGTDAVTKCKAGMPRPAILRIGASCALGMLLLAVGGHSAWAQADKPADKTVEKGGEGKTGEPKPAIRMRCLRCRSTTCSRRWSWTARRCTTRDGGHAACATRRARRRPRWSTRRIRWTGNEPAGDCLPSMAGRGHRAVYLNLGAIGPKHLTFAQCGRFGQSDPATLTDNPGTWLDFTDLVFIDPIGTGFCEVAGATRRRRKKLFYSADAGCGVSVAGDLRVAGEE